jgi:hypothetical protein
MESVIPALLCFGALYLLAAAVVVAAALVSGFRVEYGSAGQADKERLRYLKDMRTLAMTGSLQDTIFVILALPLIAWFAVFP